MRSWFFLVPADPQIGRDADNGEVKIGPDAGRNHILGKLPSAVFVTDLSLVCDNDAVAAQQLATLRTGRVWLGFSHYQGRH